jgi:hypothetical protein
MPWSVPGVGVVCNHGWRMGLASSFQAESTMTIRALVTLRLVSDAETAATLMKQVANYTRDHFGDDLRFEPFIDDHSGRVIWLNAAVDEDTLVRWEQAMRESGIRERVMGTLELVTVELLDPITDPRLERLRANATQLRSLLE